MNQPIKNNQADLIWQGPGGTAEVLALHAEQAISQLHTTRVELKSEDAGLDFEDMLFKDAKVALLCGEDFQQKRFFGGIITAFSQNRSRHGHLNKASKPTYNYLVVIRPRFWLTSRQFRSQIFQEVTVQDIVKELLDDHAVSYDWRVNGSLKNWDYKVQYEESDYHFISRLLEEAGICFYFDQEEDLVIFADETDEHDDCRPQADVAYVEEISPRYQQGRHEFIADFSYRERIGPGRVELYNYHYETSQLDLTVEATSKDVPNYPRMEVYEHTQNYHKRDEGSRFVELRNQALVSASKTALGTASCRGFEAGYLFYMSDHFRGDFNKGWLLTSCNISVQQGKYQCRFSALPLEVPFRPPRTTAKPKVAGLQTAIVTGPEGEQVYLDDMGRCKLQFHWDREGEHTDRSSMWVRVANNYAGKDYGIQWIPRIGHEVLVTFVNGDPDQPIVTGRVYNDQNTAPLGEADKYRNIIKTIADNHIIFDDTEGEENFDVRAHKDMNTFVGNDDSQTVRRDRGIQVDRNHNETIDKNMTIQVGENLKEGIGKNYKETIGNNYDLRVGDDMTTNVGENQTLTVGEDQTQQIKGNINIHGACNYTLNIDEKASVKVGKQISVRGEKDAIVNIKDKLTILVGKASVVIKKNGDIEIQGKNIKVNAQKNIVMRGNRISLN